MKKYFPFLSFIVIFILAVSCHKDNMESATDIEYLKIGEGYASGAAVKVELYADQSLTTGYNALYIALYDSVSKQAIENARVTLTPMMDMGTMKHSSPVENPSAAATSKLFVAAAVFTMPSTSTGAWTIDINVTVNGKQGSIALPLTVTDPSTSRLKSFVSKADSAKFFVAFIQPGSPKVGTNDMEIAIYKKKSMMEFPADSSLQVTLTPEMPTMGHGSPNNIDPVHAGKGHYKGKVNFTMTGLWYLNLDFKSGTAVADTATFFEVNF